MSKSVQYLNIILSNTFVLYTKTLNFHRNVQGQLFPQLHEFFGSQYEALAEDADTVAERIRALQANSPATMKEFLALTSLKEPVKGLKDMEMVAELLKDREMIIAYIKETLSAIEGTDPGTSNMLEDMIEAHEKQAWMLRATVAKG